ncbi:Ribonuclease H-like superfamily [Sesbania bispinosa]|nr:Ribonuclease H-like superfamily [Sesbania bispinosa]
MWIVAFIQILHIGIGGVIRDSDCKWVLGFNGFAGLGHILSAELFAILHGLTIAWDRGLLEVILESNSLEAIQIIQLDPLVLLSEPPPEVASLILLDELG